ncbi:MAG TPA: ATP-binding protein [Dissulfurispiraceae bacterium]
MAEMRSRDIYSTVALTCGMAALYAGCLALLAWAMDWGLFTGIRGEYTPISPNSAICSALLGCALFYRCRGKATRPGDILSKASIFIVLSIGFLTLAQFAFGKDMGVDRLFIDSPLRFGRFPAHAMSPLSSVSFIFAGGAMLLLLYGTGKTGAVRAAAVLSSVALSSGLMILLGYLYGVPFFYGGTGMPTSLFGAINFVVLGAGMVSAAGPQCWPLRPFVGQSIQARMMRAFLPLIGAIFLVEKWLDMVIFVPSNSNPALISMLTAVFSMFVASAFVSEISQFISEKIERAEAEQGRLQETIEQAKNDWEESFDIINDAITIHDKDFNIIRANKAAVELLDTTFKLMLKQKCYASYHGTDCPPQGCPSCRTLRTGVDSVAEIFEPRLGKFLEMKALGRFDRDNNIAGVVHVVRDITGRKKAEAKLQESHERLITVLDSLDAAVYVADTDTYEILYANKYLRDIYGEVEGKICWQALRRSEATPCDSCRRHADIPVLDGGEAPEIREWEFRDRTNGKWYEARERIIKWIDDRIVRLEIAVDITAHKRSEDALLAAFKRAEEEKAKSEAIIAAIGDGISIQDTDFRIIYQNRMQEDFIGRHIGEHCYAAYEKREHVCEGCPVAISLKDGGVHRAERSVLTEKGTMHVEITTSPLRGADGEVIAAIEVVRDVTESRRLKDQLLHAQKLQAVGQLAGGIAHDFNNILTAIMGYVYMLQIRMDKDSPLMTYVKEILDSTTGAANLTRSLLAFSRKQIINPKPLNLNEIIIRVGKLLRNLIGEEIELKIETAYYDLNVIADSLHIEQVLMNLIMNAKDAMPGGGEVSITTERMRLDNEFIRTHGYGKLGSYALISVSDSGTGMDEKTRERIFEPFFTTKETGKGTGLGLSIAFGIVKQHDGYINVYSEPGRGTTFRIYLPLITEKVLESSFAEESLPEGGSELILVAEDESSVRRSMKNMLEGFGYKVLEATDGEDAVAKFMDNREAVRLVIVDIIMPKKNGKEVYDELRKMSPGVKVLFTSGYTADIIHKKGILDEGLNFISKPVMPNELLRKIREVMDT